MPPMSRVEVRRRIGPLPWARPSASPARVVVGREGWMDPEPGPLALYQTVWPERFLVWDAKRQLWAIWSDNPVTGQRERITFLYWDDAPPKEDGTRYTQRELEAIYDKHDRPRIPGLRVYRPFDYDYVNAVLRQEWRERHEGFKALEAERIAQAEALSKSRRKDVAREYAAAHGEIKRYLPVMAAYQHYGRLDAALAEKIPQVTGATLTPATAGA